MKRVLLAALVFVMLCAAAPAFAAQDAPIAGGYGERRTSDPGVAAAARFAVRERGRLTGRRVTLIAVRRAETQVVAGLNYRLLLSVTEGRAARDVVAIVYQNLRQRLSLESWEPASVGGPSSGREVKVFLVALDDKGRRGRRIGCDDSLVPVTRNVAAAGTPLKAAVEELLSIPREYEGLGNYWAGEGLRVQSATIASGVATIRIRGTLPVAGVCDEPRIEEQIKATARQFRGVRSVRVFLNGQRLSNAIR
ncbi:MAG TPA: GerMN domain-containing protein [Pyrinomonadaceae bacterium]